METPKAYLSFDYEHNSKEKKQFVEQSKTCREPFIIEYESSEPTLPTVQWDNVVSDKINYSNMLIVLVGKKTGSTASVAREIAEANSLNIPVFGIYIEGTDTETELPHGLERSRTIQQDWNKIADKIQEVMKEGKNELLWS
ncbi:MAG TPA: TIR domain-containing protein [Bacteroidia bacterium]|nr:TIR domain-containing protein [Bacteroidia bacterium]